MLTPRRSLAASALGLALFAGSAGVGHAAELVPSNFTQSNFTQSNFTQSNFTQSNFTQSNFTQSNFTQSNFTQSNFTQSLASGGPVDLQVLALLGGLG